MLYLWRGAVKREASSGKTYPLDCHVCHGRGLTCFFYGVFLMGRDFRLNQVGEAATHSGSHKTRKKHRSSVIVVPSMQVHPLSIG